MPEVVERPVRGRGGEASQLVYFLTVLVELLLAFRLLLRLFGASSGSVFVRFIYNVSYFLASPFFGAFNIRTNYGLAQLEVATLFAMLVYALVGYLLIYLVRLFERRI